jgi:hypothetical protein
MELALTSDAQELSVLNFGRPLVVGEKYRVRRADGGTEDGWQLLMLGPSGKLVLTKIASIKTNCMMLRN